MNNKLKIIIILTFYSFVFSFKSFSQDTLITRDGTTLTVNIISVGSSEVKYKRADMPDGATFTEPKKNIESIKYQTGKLEVFNKKEVKANDSISSPVVDNEIAIIKGHKYYGYKNKPISENRVRRLMMIENDPEINGLLKKSKREKGLQYIGLGAIPCGVVTVEYLALGAFASVFALFAVPYAAVGIVCVTVGVISKESHKKNLRKAIKIYNAKYSKR